MNDNLGQLNVGDFIAIIRHEVAPIVKTIKALQSKIIFLEKIGKIDEDLHEHTGKLKSLSKDIESFKSIILEQQKYMES